MKAIVLAAGQGARLRPLTDGMPKALVPFRGRPILEQILGALTAAGIRDVVVVTGYRGDEIAALGVPTRPNPDFAATNMVHSLFCAQDWMEDGALVVYGDIVFRSSIVRALLEDPAPLAVAVNRRWRELWELRMADPLTDAETLRMDGQGRIVEIGKKPRSLDEVEGQYAGLIRMSGDAARRVRNFYHGLDTRRLYDGKDFRNMYFTSFLQEIADRLMPIQAVPFDGGWVEIDSLSDLAAYERLPADFFDESP
ncbi:MAG: phosphocholine cytidylyltransferase family protein [Planctomycetes bacterium]|nr:phosphocholine cytidylyltransferase family protein [Planctomycetota bacterium]